ncbi:uridine kinase [Caminicella sporogenes DSM 14501]|uniref:Uridine kinase n=1 Tax=Caminicella sporogenes DSM 14501 TaxID=1121266 RepID=A0A1M6MVG7_9FIRM|nr:nucleoside kinase [Caminicella sporogenes]SHJ87447.1 uridine kinase [Caminicella sporogenes DSM 14501]
MTCRKKIFITLNDGTKFEVDKGITLEKLIDFTNYESKALIVAAKVNNLLRELNYEVVEDSHIEFIDLTTTDGQRIYKRSLSFVFIRAAMEILPDCRVSVEHSLSKGLYCEIHYERPINEEDVKKIEKRMKEIIDKNVPFKKETISKEEARKIFRKYKMEAKEKLLEYREKEFINIYSCGWLKDYFYGYMVPSTGYLKIFKLKYYMPGVIIQYPTIDEPNKIPEFVEQPKLAAIFKEAEKWGQILNIGYVANLNEKIQNNEYPELIRIAEALHEKKIAQIADMITERNKRVVLIAGPSSSGKTTFAQRLLIQLKVNGLNPVTLSTDDYFVNREDTPRDENGNYDFEALEAVDLKLFNEHLIRLIQGEEVEIPVFNFKIGKREYKGNVLKITKEQPIIIEGIHGLNEKLTKDIPCDKKFKIYVSALTQLNIDDHNRIPTTDTRLIRRIVRDSKYRGHSALTTLKLWPSVRRGEERNIFPYQEEADVMFNSALVYELAVLKKYAEPLLKEISENEPEYSEVKRLLKFLSYFKSIDDEKYILQTSILKEFIGGSCFVE